MRSGKWEKARILLVDDDGPIRSSLRIFFEAEGYEFLGVESAEKGLEEVGRQHYDVIIADYRLPGMDGLEFLRTIRETHPRNQEDIHHGVRGARVVFRGKTNGSQRVYRETPDGRKD